MATNMKRTGYLLLGLVCLIPGLILGSVQYVSPYNNLKGAFVESTMDDASIDFLDASVFNSVASAKYVPGYTIFLSVSSRITGLGQVHFHLLPIGVVFFSFFYFALARRLFKSLILAAWFAIYGSIDSSLIFLYNTTFYSLAFPLYLLFVLLLLKSMEKRRFEWIICMFLIFTGTFYIHSPTSSWMIASLLGFSFCMLVHPRDSNQNITKGGAGWSLSTALIVFFLSFNRLLYEHWIPTTALFELGDAFSIFATQKFGFGPWATEKYTTTLHDPIFNLLRVCQYVVIFVPISLWCSKYLMKRLRGFLQRIGYVNQNNLGCVWIIILLTAMVDIFIYTMNDTISLKYIGLTFPVLMVFALLGLGRGRRVFVGMMTILTILIVASACLSIKTIVDEPPLRYEEVGFGGGWLLEESVKNRTILTDINTFSLLLYVAAHLDTDFSVTFYDSKIYSHLVEEEYRYSERSYLGQKFDYMIVDRAGLSRPIRAPGNIVYEPLSWHNDQINKNTNIGLVYEDGFVAIYSAG